MELLNEILAKLPESNKIHQEFIKKKYNIKNIQSLDKAVLFGSQKTGRNFLNIFKKLNLKINAFSDNNNKLWGYTIEDILVISPNDIINFKDLPVIITSKYIKEISQQLKGLGYINIIPHYIISYVFQNYFQIDFILILLKA